MNEMPSDLPAPPRRPWERTRPVPAVPPASPPASTAGSNPWTPPAADAGLELLVRVDTDDEVAASRLCMEADMPRGGLGSALLGGLLMLTLVVVVRGTASGQWKSRFPEGASLLAILVAVALFAALGWLVGAWLLPFLRRSVAHANIRRILLPAPGEGPLDGGGPARVVLGRHAIHWTAPHVARRFDVALLRGLVEGPGHLVLRFGLVTVFVLPRRDLSPDQEAAVRDWVAQHVRGGQAPGGVA